MLQNIMNLWRNEFDRHTIHAFTLVKFIKGYFSYIHPFKLLVQLYIKFSPSCFLPQMTVILWNCFSILIDQECYEKVSRHQGITASIFSTNSSESATLVRTGISVSMRKSNSTYMKSFNVDKSTRGYVSNSLSLIVYHWRTQCSMY